jgi:hypothetical protein
VAPIIAVIVMLFSAKATGFNGPIFLGGWALALLVVSGAV